MFRLHIDVPLFDDEAKSIEIGKRCLDAAVAAMTEQLKNNDLHLIQYRLARDEDRTPKNFFEKNENGHVPTGKAKIEI